MRSRLFFSLFLGLSFCGSVARAGLDLPGQLTQDNRVTALKILGPTSAYKILGDPYPLGGYTGIEIGFSYEFIPTSALAKLGSGAIEASTTGFVNLTIGKGLFRDVDLFVSFAPPGQWEKFTSFGAALRWGVYELPILPMHFSVQVAGSSTGFANKINTATQGIDFVGGWNFEDAVIYAGVGYLRSSGVFIGGAAGVTESGDTMTETLSSAHGLAGVTFKYNAYFLAVQMDRSTESSYGLKLGTRF